MALPDSGCFRARSVRRTLIVLTVITALMILAACGPEKSDGVSGSPEEQTMAIARQFAADKNGDAARTALQQLDVANPSQWLTYVTESAIDDPSRNPDDVHSLVALALDLGIREATIRTYAEANGLAEPSIPASEAATVAAAMQSPVDAAALAAPAPAPAASAPVTATGPVTATSPAQGGMAGAAQAAPAADNAPITPPAAATAPADIPTATPTPQAAMVAATQATNLRQGPGTDYGLAGALNPGDTATIVSKNPAGDWWEVTVATGGSAWVYGPLVTVTGSTDSIGVEANIPTPPPVVAEAAPAEPAPAEAAPAEAPPAEEATPAPPAPDPNAQPHFTLVSRRLWSKDENGTCRGQHLLRVIVLDANGNPLNGVTLTGLYTGQVLVTGSQGKGDGRIEFDLYGTGEGFAVTRDNDGRDATSDRAEGFTTKSRDIDVPTLIAAGYCSSEADCQVFYNSYGCTGHHSWEAIFKRNY